MRGKDLLLVLAKEGQVEKNGERGSVCCEDNDLRDTTVQGLGSLVGTLLQLTEVGSLLNNVKNFLGQSRIGDGPSLNMLEAVRSLGENRGANSPADPFCSSAILME